MGDKWLIFFFFFDFVQTNDAKRMDFNKTTKNMRFLRLKRKSKFVTKFHSVKHIMWGISIKNTFYCFNIRVKYKS